MSESQLRQGLDELGISAPGAADLLERFLAELDRWNARFGFVKATREELVARHVLDSIAGAATVATLCASGGPGAGGGPGAAPIVAPGGVLDVGSGAGFPGIPLAVALPGVRFTLLERSAKKCAFLENCRALLGLANVGVLRADLAGAAGGYNVVTFRAVAPLGRFLADLARSKVTWRSVAAYKGRRDRIEEELAALGGAARDMELVRLRVPFVDEERHLVVLYCGGAGAGRIGGILDNTVGRG